MTGYMETVVIGIDGGEWDIIEPLIDEGSLPNLSDLVETGVYGDLKSITPPVSPPAWTSIQTGVNPGKHGIYDFSKFDEHYQRHSLNASERKSSPFWKVMNDSRVTTGLFKIPFTYPPNDVDGFLVTGFPTPNSVQDYTVPQNLTAEVKDPSELFENEDYLHEGDYKGYKHNLVRVANRQSEQLIKLVKENDTDFLMTVYVGSDRIQHFYWKYFDESHPRYKHDADFSSAFKEYYQAVDDGIGELLDEAGKDTNVVVLSDHGFGKLSHDIYIDEWLDQEGFLSRVPETDPKEAGRRGVAIVLKKSWEIVEGAGLNHHIRAMLPESLFSKGADIQPDLKSGIEWEGTEAFFSTLSGQAIFINLEDRFTDGVVSWDGYDDIVERLQSSLLNLKHPETGDNLVVDVVRTDDEFYGWALEEAPDLIVETAPEYTLKGGRSDSLIEPSKQHQNDRSGDHRSKGILVANGPDFTSGKISDASVLDIAPTLLYLCRCPIPESMDGEILMDLFNAEATDARTVEKTDEYGRTDGEVQQWTQEEETELKEQLSSMGYLE